jgi:hypothetical protein
MCVCVYVFVRVCVCVCVCVCVHAYMRVKERVRAYVRACVRVCVYVLMLLFRSLRGCECEIRETKDLMAINCFVLLNSYYTIVAVPSLSAQYRRNRCTSSMITHT